MLFLDAEAQKYAYVWWLHLLTSWKKPRVLSRMCCSSMRSSRFFLRVSLFVLISFTSVSSTSNLLSRSIMAAWGNVQLKDLQYYISDIHTMQYTIKPYVSDTLRYTHCIPYQMVYSVPHNPFFLACTTTHVQCISHVYILTPPPPHTPWGSGASTFPPGLNSMPTFSSSLLRKRNFLSISSQRRTSLMNLRWKAFTSAFTCVCVCVCVCVLIHCVHVGTLLWHTCVCMVTW